MKLPPGHVAGQGVVKPKCTGGFGERMLRIMGWHSGEGLGKEGTGIKEAIQVKKKEDAVGVGGNGSYDWGNKWWEKAFDSAVATVDDSGSSSDSSDSDSDDEHMAAIVAAVNRDGTRTSASADELKLLASLSKKGGRVTAGRFGGRDAKMARIRAQEAAMAGAASEKLGVPSGAARAAGAAGGGSDLSDTTSEVQLSGGSGKKRKGGAKGEAAPSGGDASSGRQQQEVRQGEQQQQQPAKRQRIVIELEAPQSGPQRDFKPTPSTGWWGASIFASAGCMAGVDKETAEAARRRMTFNEDDQARIYNNAQAKKTQGKVGLGQGTGTVKVGGVKWSGNRVSFEEPEGGAEADEAAAAAAAAGDDETRARLAALGSSTHLAALGSGEGAAEGGKRREKKKGRKSKGAAQQAEQQQAARPAVPPSEQQQQQAAQPSAAGGDTWHAAVKWRKIIGAQLAAAAQQQLKLKQLQKQVVAAVLEKHGSVVSDKAAVKAAFAARLASSSKWVVEGKVVRLCSE